MIGDDFGLDGVTTGCRGADFWSRVSPQLAAQVTRLDELAQAVAKLRQRLYAAGSPIHAYREPPVGVDDPRALFVFSGDA